MISVLILAACIGAAASSPGCGDTEPSAMLQMWEKVAQTEQEQELCQKLDLRCSKILDADACIELLGSTQRGSATTSFAEVPSGPVPAQVCAAMSENSWL